MNKGFFRKWSTTHATQTRWDGPKESPDSDALEVVFDTRSLQPILHSNCVFVAIQGEFNDGHHFLQEAHKKGIQMFWVQKDPGPKILPNCDVVEVPDSILCLQKLTRAWREANAAKIVGITGSNGKTIVKEWLSCLINAPHETHLTPRSYNSQLGVAISLWELRPQHRLGLIEVGISQPAEMDALAETTSPEFGVFTHFGNAHLEAFESPQHLLREKLKLFAHCRWVVLPGDLHEAKSMLQEMGVRIICWGAPGSGCDLEVMSQNVFAASSEISLKFRGPNQEVTFVVTLSVPGKMAHRNAMTAICAAMALGVRPDAIVQRMGVLKSLDMRMERLQTPAGTWVLSDAWTNDWSALSMAMSDLVSLPETHPKAAILGPISGMGDDASNRLESIIRKHPISKLWLVGHEWDFAIAPMDNTTFVPTLDDMLDLIQTCPEDFSSLDILVKGRRRDVFERITEQLLKQGHSTTLTIDLEAIVYNLRTLRHHVQTAVQRPLDIIAVIKASAYGASAIAVGHALARRGVNLFAVAGTQEGVELRRSGLNQRIFVFNPNPATFSTLLAHDLEPEIHSIDHLQSLLKIHRQGNHPRWPIHLKVDSGMHRLGFNPEEIPALMNRWRTENWSQNLEVASVFSHLSSAEDPDAEASNQLQFRVFQRSLAEIREALSPERHRLQSHILNSAGCIRFPEHAGDCVRIGIALYGIGPVEGLDIKLQPAISWRTTISAIREVPAGEGVGYGLTDAANHPRRIATLPVGYADGWPRHLSNGKGWVMIQGQPAQVVGRVNMDMTTVDITNINQVRVGDEATLFGDRPSIEEMADAAQTIPYEILCRISPRVRRVQVGD